MLWLVLMSHPAEDRRLSLRGWLVACQGSIPVNRVHLNTDCPDVEYVCIALNIRPNRQC